MQSGDVVGCACILKDAKNCRLVNKCDEELVDESIEFDASPEFDESSETVDEFLDFDEHRSTHLQSLTDLARSFEMVARFFVILLIFQ